MNKKTGTPAAGSPLNKYGHGAPIKNLLTKKKHPNNYLAHNKAHHDGTFKSSSDHSPAKHLGHGPFSNADHSIADHAKNFLADPMGTTKKVVKQTGKKVVRKTKNLARNIGYGATHGLLFGAMGYDHPFGGKSNPSVKNEKYGGPKKEEKTKTKTKRRKTTKKVDNTPKDPYTYY